MAPDVLLRKLTFLRQLLTDLAPYREATLDEVEADHYKLERLLELLVMVASDIVHHLLAEQKQTPTSYKDTFHLAAQAGLLPADLSERLQQVASMRNVLVHLYEQIDYTILQASIPQALDDFSQFVAILAQSPDVGG